MKNSITVNDLAALSNLTTRRIRQLSEEAKLPPIKRGSLPMPQAVSMLFAFYQKTPEDLTRERLLLVSANRKLKETELAKTESVLIDRALANTVMAGVVLTLKGWMIEETEQDSPAKRKAKLESLDASPSLVAGFHAYDIDASQATISRICRKCQQEVKNTQIKIDQQNKSNEKET